MMNARVAMMKTTLPCQLRRCSRRAAEIPPQSQMQTRQHERQDLMLETLVEKESEGGHGQGLPGG
jgi:hypothetical protein